MNKCEYGNCTNEGEIKGFVLSKDDTKPEGHTPVDVIACKKHSKLKSFFPYKEDNNGEA